MLYGIVVNGAEGGEKVMKILAKELDQTMALSGMDT